MTGQIRPSVTNPTIANIYKDILDGLLILAPEFQRKFVWTQEHQEEFIDTILNGLPFPEIYLATGDIDIEKMQTTRFVIDGQQRLTTIKNYIEGKFDKPLKIIKTYQALDDGKKGDFLSYQVVVRDLGKIPDEIIREIFRRINLTKFKLDTVEIHNAIYDGAFIKTAKLILDSAGLSIFGVFKESEYSRMSDLYFILTVMATIENGGYFMQDSRVEEFIERYNEAYPNSGKTADTLKSVFEFVALLQLPPDSMWFRKANFFTMIVELSSMLPNVRVDVRDRLLELENSVQNHKLRPDTEFGKYYSYMYQNTNGRNARVIRGTMFRQFCGA